MHTQRGSIEAMEAATLGPTLDDIDLEVVHELDRLDVELAGRLRPTAAGGPAGWAAVAKRSFDIAAAALLLLLLLPVLVIAAIGVKVSSEGPIFFRQSRVGRHGRLFSMLKLRTFPVDHVDEEQSLPVRACPLPWGRYLRRTSIDELPQLWNVLKGDMSLVGPRPERPQFANELAREVPTYRERHRAPVGITGLAQIRGLCGTTSIEARVASDNEYIDGWTVGRDVRILLRTIPTVVRKFYW